MACCCQPNPEPEECEIRSPTVPVFLPIDDSGNTYIWEATQDPPVSVGPQRQTMAVSVNLLAVAGVLATEELKNTSPVLNLTVKSPDNSVVWEKSITYPPPGEFGYSRTDDFRFCKPQGVEDLVLEASATPALTPQEAVGRYELEIVATIQCIEETDLGEVEDADLELQCAPADAEYSGNEFVYIKVEFSAPESVGQCSDLAEEIQFVFEVCEVDPEDSTACASVGTKFAFATEGGVYTRENAYPVTLDEIALLWPNNNSTRPYVWLGLANPANDVTLGVRIRIFDSSTNQTSAGSLFLSVRPRQFLCDWFTAIDYTQDGGRFSIGTITEESLGAGLYRFAGTLENYDLETPCERKVGSVLAIPLSQYNDDPTWANDGWVVCAEDVVVIGPGAVIEFDFNYSCISQTDSFVFAIYNFTCDTSFPTSAPVVIAYGSFGACP